MQDHPPIAAKVKGPTSNADNPTAIPKTERPTTAAERVKSNVRKILLANPLFPRFYADVVISSAPNSKLAKILRANYQKILSQVKLNMANSSCTHIKVTGVRCDSPALRGQQFCYFHQRVHRGVRTPPQARLHPIALIEDEESIQMALMEVINALMRNTIDLKRALLILRALHIAVKNARRVKYNATSDMVKEVPEFAAPDTSLSEQTEIAHAMNIPAYNPDASRPGYIRTAAERRRDGDLPRNAPQESRDELIAHYYGYPNAAAHAAVLAAEKSKTEAVNVERAPTPANAEATTDAATNKKKLTVTAPAGTPDPDPGPQGRTRIEVSQHDTHQANKKPPMNTKENQHKHRSAAHRASAG
jgi:hypothetical protein